MRTSWRPPGRAPTWSCGSPSAPALGEGRSPATYITLVGLPGWGQLPAGARAICSVGGRDLRLRARGSARATPGPIRAGPAQRSLLAHARTRTRSSTPPPSQRERRRLRSGLVHTDIGSAAPDRHRPSPMRAASSGRSQLRRARAALGPVRQSAGRPPARVALALLRNHRCRTLNAGLGRPRRSRSPESQLVTVGGGCQ